MTWYDGGNKPVRDLLSDNGISEFLDEGKIPDSGSLFVGTKGKLFSPGDGGAGGHIIGGVEVGDIKFPVSPGHWEEFVRAIKTNNGEPAVSNFGTEVLHGCAYADPHLIRDLRG